MKIGQSKLLRSRIRLGVHPAPVKLPVVPIVSPLGKNAQATYHLPVKFLGYA